METNNFTKWEEIELLKQEKSKEASEITGNLEAINSQVKEAIKTQSGAKELIKKRDMLEKQLSNLQEELSILDEEQKNHEISHIEEKIKLQQVKADAAAKQWHEMSEEYRQLQDECNKKLEECNVKNNEAHFKYQEEAEKINKWESKLRELKYFKENGTHLTTNAYQRKYIDEISLSEMKVTE